MDRVMLTWNIPNWITVILMVALGYLLLSFAAQLVKGRLGMFGGATGNMGGGVNSPGYGSISDFMGIGNSSSLSIGMAA